LAQRTRCACDHGARDRGSTRHRYQRLGPPINRSTREVIYGPLRSIRTQDAEVKPNSALKIGWIELSYRRARTLENLSRLMHGPTYGRGRLERAVRVEPADAQVTDGDSGQVA
jgi:hypothetical protein